MDSQLADDLRGGPDRRTASRTIQLAYLVALVVGAVLFAVIGRRSRDLTTAVLTLMPVAIAINIAVGSIAFALRLPIYLDSIGTVLVGALAGPWAGALTGILSNLIWSILPIPGGAGPTAAFFAPVAGGHRPDGRVLGRAAASSSSAPMTSASAGSSPWPPGSSARSSRSSSSRRRSASRTSVPTDPDELTGTRWSFLAIAVG